VVHPIGNRVLCAFCDVVTESLRPGDLFGRIGGEEFACLLANAFPTDALLVAERSEAELPTRFRIYRERVETAP
jgi:diguanylate cyclase (GGDEF)-like protein